MPCEDWDRSPLPPPDRYEWMRDLVAALILVVLLALVVALVEV